MIDSELRDALARTNDEAWRKALRKALGLDDIIKTNMQLRNYMKRLVVKRADDEACDFIAAHPNADWNQVIHKESPINCTIRCILRHDAPSVLAALLKIPTLDLCMHDSGRFALGPQKFACFILIIRDRRYHPGQSFHLHTALHRGDFQSALWLIATHGLLLDFNACDPMYDGAGWNTPLKLVQFAIEHQGESHVGHVRFALTEFRLDTLQMLEELIKMCLVDPWRGRWWCRLYLGFAEETASALYALAVFVSDGLLRPMMQCDSRVVRFFVIMGRLPLELQMVLCNRVYRSARDIVHHRDGESAFRELAAKKQSI